MARFAHGTTISIGGTAVGELTAIPLPGRSRDSVEITSHDSSGVREFLAGLRDSGEFTCEGRLAMGASGNTGQTAIETNYTTASASATEEFIITLPDNAGATATTFTFDGFITAINGDLPFDDVGSFSFTVKVTGEITKALATAA